MLAGTKTIRIEKWPQSDGEAKLSSRGGKLNVGDSYKSDFLVVYPFEDLADGNKVTIKIKIESSDAVVYHSMDYKNWLRVENVDRSSGVASFQTKKGTILFLKMDHVKLEGFCSGECC